MSRADQLPVNRQGMTKLRNRIDEIKPLLELSGEWTNWDIEPDMRDAICVLKRNGAIVNCGRQRINYDQATDSQKTRFPNNVKDRGTTILNVWRWKPRVRQELKNYLENRDELPCGHQLHIYNDPENDELGCKYCAEKDMHPEYSKEQVKQWLNEQ